MPLIQVGPKEFMDAARAKLCGISIYRGVGFRSTRTSAKAPPIPAAPPAPVRRTAPPRKPLPETVPQAMQDGGTNKRIQQSVADGVLEVHRDYMAARWAGWSDAECHEAQRRGLVFW